MLRDSCIGFTVRSSEYSFFQIWWPRVKTKHLRWHPTAEWGTNFPTWGVCISYIVTCIALFRVRYTGPKRRERIPPWLSSHRQWCGQKSVLVKENQIWRFHAFTADSFGILSTFPLLSTPLPLGWDHVPPSLVLPWAEHGSPPTSCKLGSAYPKAAREPWPAWHWAPRAVSHGWPFTAHHRGDVGGTRLAAPTPAAPHTTDSPSVHLPQVLLRVLDSIINQRGTYGDVSVSTWSLRSFSPPIWFIGRELGQNVKSMLM